MKSKFAKKTLAALVLAAALTSVASVPAFADEGISTVSTDGNWVISKYEWQDDDLAACYKAGTMDCIITLTDETGTYDDYTDTVTATMKVITKAACEVDEVVNFGFTYTADTTLGGTSNYYTISGTALKHNYVKTATEVTPATCMEDGTTTYTWTCSLCGKSYTTSETISATGHSDVDDLEWYVDMTRLTNILLDSNGDLVLGTDGKPQAADTSKNAYYYLIKTCEHKNAEGNTCGVILAQKEVMIPLTTGTETYVFVDVSDGDLTAPWGTHNLEALTDTTKAPSNTVFVGDYDNGNAYSAIIDVLAGTKDLDDVIRLVDCTKSGTYTVISYNLIDADGDPYDYGNWNVLGVTSYTIAAQHYELVAQIDADNEANSSYLLKKADGTIVPKYDSDGNVVGAYNTHCTESATVVLEYICQNCGKVVKTETVTIEPTGVHQLIDSTAKASDTPNYTAIKITDEVTGEVTSEKHTYNIVKKCSICGQYIEAGTATEYHDKQITSENVVAATCGTSGSFDMVISCADCGWEFSRVTITSSPTDKHVYGAYTITWDNNLYVAGWQDGNLVTTKATVSQTCVNCNGQGEEGHEGVLVSEEAAVGDPGVYSDTYHHEQLGLLVVTMGEPTKTSYACSPATVELTATLYKTDSNGNYVDADGNIVSQTKAVVLATSTKTVSYYGSVADYEARTSHVAGVAKTVVENGNTYSVVYCTECGIELDRTLVSAASTTKLAAVTGLKASATVDSNAVTLTWNAVSGADYYLILAYRDGAYAGQIGYTATLKYVDSDASTAEYNFYWVLACYKNEAGTMIAGELGSYVYGIQPLAQVANLAATSANGTVTLTWDAVDRASYYKVMYGKSGSTLTTTTTTSTTFTDTTATAGEYSSYVVIAMYDTPSCGGVASVQSSSVTVLVQ